MQTQLNYINCLIKMFDFANQHLRLWPVQLNYNMICNQSFSVQIWKQQKNVERFTILRVILAPSGGGSSLSIETNRNNWNNWNTFEKFGTKLKQLEQNLKQVVSFAAWGPENLIYSQFWATSWHFSTPVPSSELN